VLLDEKRFEGNLGVLPNILKKEMLLRRGNPAHETYRTGIVVNGGAMRGTIGAAQLAALYDFGILSAFDVAFTGSTGTPPTLFYGSGDIAHTRDVYYKECTTDTFLSFARLVAWRTNPSLAPAMNIDYLCDDVLGMRFNADTYRLWRTAHYATVTTSEGESAYLDMKALPDPMQGTKASIAIPGLSRGHVAIGDKIYFDGDGAAPFPAAEAINRFSLTDILVLANRPRPKEDRTGRALSEEAIPKDSPYLQKVPVGVREAFATKHLRYVDGLDALRKQKTCRYLIIWTDGSIGQFTTNAKRLKAASCAAQQELRSVLQECQVPMNA